MARKTSNFDSTKKPVLITLNKTSNGYVIADKSNKIFIALLASISHVFSFVVSTHSTLKVIQQHQQNFSSMNNQQHSSVRTNAVVMQSKDI